MGSGPRGSKSMVGRAQPVLGVLCAVWVTVAAISVETPHEVLRAARGKSVTLPCTYHASTSTFQGLIEWDKLLWSHTEKVAVLTLPARSLSHGDRYQHRVTFSDNAQQSDASITIDQLTMDDNGTYECSVSLLQDLEGTSKGRVRLLVLVPPSKPDCGIQGEMVIGNDIQLTCQSEEGSPAPQYSWKSYDLRNQERAGPPGMGQTLTLKNISTDTSGFYICTSSNEVGTESCNITVTASPPSMNVALYVGIAGGTVVALILISVLIYCCCCRVKGEDEARPNRSIYREPQEQLRELSQGRQEEDNSEHGDTGSRRHS
ncbi:cell surface A33 antigen [Sturnira hondurensis]|uniref:cell surface A33 antigen n=1 Tax=Sturnira hondurensis TaxID=192404 RepID=UPI00187AC7D7|nr:cell surface A33 antigen [Sturnira hondurensis]